MKPFKLFYLWVPLVFPAAFSSQGALLDRGGGLIYDTVLNVTWLQDANFARTMGYDVDGAMTWAQSIAWADWLVYQGYSDWRLPLAAPVNGTNWQQNYTYDGSSDEGYNIGIPGTAYAGTTASELAHLYYVTLSNPARYDTNGIDREIGRTNSGLFINLGSVYWTGTPYPPFINHAWRLNLNVGEQATGWRILRDVRISGVRSATGGFDTFVWSPEPVPVTAGELADQQDCGFLACHGGRLLPQVKLVAGSNRRFAGNNECNGG